ncbi:DM9 repeat-containing protein [Ralstonia solanacearum]|uniref:DM9 repeat-containing protein n=1 Tax=Ralstonia solanacearum TaxID=305 RepID=UPI000A119123|nr:DM9 repeat-containing protein [Ralstonia solanacearum]
MGHGRRGGQIPAGAIALGHEADGREQFACRAQQGNGVRLGKISAGSGGCSIGFAGRELTLANYEVLVEGAAPPLRAISKLNAKTSLLAGTAVVVPPKPVVPGPAPTIDASGSVSRGFDEAGHPYVQQRKADGTMVRILPSGTQTTHPGGRQDFIPTQVAMSNAPMPTPPELPADPQQGRRWLDQHNEALLDLIRTLGKR